MDVPSNMSLSAIKNLGKEINIYIYFSWAVIKVWADPFIFKNFGTIIPRPYHKQIIRDNLIKDRWLYFLFIFFNGCVSNPWWLKKHWEYKNNRWLAQKIFTLIFLWTSYMYIITNFKKKNWFFYYSSITILKPTRSSCIRILEHNKRLFECV